MTTIHGGLASDAALREQYPTGGPSHTATSEALLSDRAFVRRPQPTPQRKRVRLTLANGEAILAYLPPEPDWFWGTLHALSRLSALPPNWDSYGAVPITDEAVMGAINALARVLAERSSVPIIVPTSLGGVQLEWHRQGADVEIEIGPNGEPVELSLSDPSHSRAYVSQTLGPTELRHVVEAVGAL